MTSSPADVWRSLAEGNERFIDDRPDHPRQDARRRGEIAAAQTPTVAMLGCSDSRVAAEVLFDQGLGDLFVVRNAGQIASTSAVASLEYAVVVLGVRLIVVLAHDGCGAVQAAVDITVPGAAPLPATIAAHVAGIRPAIGAVRAAGGAVTVEAVGHAHLEWTVADLLARSELIAAAVADGSVGIVGAEYRLAQGRVEQRLAVGMGTGGLPGGGADA